LFRELKRGKGMFLWEGTVFMWAVGLGGGGLVSERDFLEGMVMGEGGWGATWILKCGGWDFAKGNEKVKGKGGRERGRGRGREKEKGKGKGEGEGEGEKGKGKGKRGERRKASRGRGMEREGKGEEEDERERKEVE
jgi:hypothetical protein